MTGYTIIGWIGALSYVLGYLLLSLRVVSAERVTFHLLNSIGGCCLVIHSVFLNDIPNFFVNLVWMLIALYSIVRAFKLLRKQKII
jgi:hypothetical protein